jgi:DNA-3-methyladenine glycosylase I
MNKKRCHWCGNDPQYISYHDNEWGVPLHDEQALFEFLVLESFQAGLSWITVLRKREDFREAFDFFDIEKVSHYAEAKIQSLMDNEKIIRNRPKIEAAINNAQKVLEIQNEFYSFDSFLWENVDGKPIQNTNTDASEVSNKTELSEKLSKDLKKRGFKFIGPTTAYAFMQAVGMVNDHVEECFRNEELQ